jgi:hypothetical protein
MKKLLGIIFIFITINSNSFSQTINLECKGSYGFNYVVVIDLENMLLDAQYKQRGFPDKLDNIITSVDEDFIYAETDIEIQTWEDDSKTEVQGFIVVDRRLGTIRQEIKTLIDTRDKNKLDRYKTKFFSLGINTNYLNDCKKINVENKF